ncbi:MAG: TlpA disulfide reductase family protein [Ginsengibacter sp.]
MKTICIAVVLLMPFIPGYSQEYTIKGKINSPDSLMILFGNGIVKTDTLFTKSGEFYFHGKLKHPDLMTLIVFKAGKREYVKRDFFIEGGEIIVNTNFHDLYKAKIVMPQHDAQDKYNEFRKRFNPLVTVARSIIDSSYTGIRIVPEKKLFINLYNRVNQIEKEVAESFVLENTDNIVGAFVFCNYDRIEDYERLYSIYQMFSPTLQDSRFLKSVKDKIVALYSLKNGNPVMTFSATSSSNQIITLSDFRGKYVVLDFWGTWCSPCLKGFAKMKKYYNKFQDKIEFISIACNDTDSDWRKAIKEYKLNWIQILNKKDTDDLESQYNVETFSTKILIDKDGNLVQVFKGETDDFYDKLDSMFEQKKRNRKD